MQMFIRVLILFWQAKWKVALLWKKDFLEPVWKRVSWLFCDCFGLDDQCARVQCVAQSYNVGLIYAKFRL